MKNIRKRNLYSQKKEIVRKSLLREARKMQGDFCMTLPQMADKFNTSVGTMSKIVATLQEDGVLRSIKGKGITLGNDSIHQNKCICWTIPNSSRYDHPFRREMEEGFIEATSKLNYSFMTVMVPTEDYYNQNAQILLNLFEKRVISGAVLPAGSFVEVATSYNIPYAMDQQSENDDIWSVDFYPYRSYEWLVECLTDLRHRRIAFFTNRLHSVGIEVQDRDCVSSGINGDTLTAQDKLARLYSECARTQLIDGRPEWFTSVDMLNEQTPEEIVDWYSSQQEKPSALFVLDATAAWSVVNVLRNKGIRVPEDVSVAGLGSALVNSELSMWEVPFAKGASACVRMIKNQIDGNLSGSRHEEVCGRLRLGKTIKPFMEKL